MKKKIGKGVRQMLEVMEYGKIKIKL